MCSSRSSSSPSRSWVNSSFLDHFGSFLLYWFELWRELSLSTEENQLILHELADRTISWLGLKNRCFFVLLRFLMIDLKLDVDVLKISSQHSQEPTCKVSSQSELFWSSFDPFFLGSCCCFWTARCLREKNTEPPDLLLKIYVWAFRVLVLRSVFCFVFLASQGTFSKYSCH
jgi:hypothetical protein